MEDNNGWLGVGGGSKKRGKRRRKRKVKEEVQIDNLFHSVDVTKQFAEINVVPPNYKNQVQNTVN